MTKYKDYYYTTRLEEVSSRNNSSVLKYYSWAIRNKEYEVLHTSTENCLWKEAAEIEAQENIDEYYY